MPTVEEFTIESENQLVNFIYGNKVGGKDIGRRVFRGQSDPSWPLVPSALRGTGHFIHHDVTKCTNFYNATKEAENILKFVTIANESGIHWPGDEEIINFRNITYHNMFINSWPNEKYLEIISIMQHYGIQTRLLDWTFKPDISLYFAINGWIKKKCKDFVTIWALDYYIPCSFSDHFNFYIPPYYRNENIQKQHGVFTYVKEDVLSKKHQEIHDLGKIIKNINIKTYKEELTSEKNKPSDEREKAENRKKVDNLEKKISKLKETTILLKVNIAIKLCPVAYQILGNNRSKAESVFHGLSGVTQRMLDDNLVKNGESPSM